MELHQLRYFVALANTGSFSRAAEHCHVSQPSLSQQIQKLEAELGERLIDRLPRQATLTAAGKVFLRRAQNVLSEIAAAQSEVRDSGKSPKGVLTVGVLPTIAPYFLPRVLAAFGVKFPSVEVVVQEDTTTHLLKMAEEAELDLVIASALRLQHERFAMDFLFSEELMLVLPAEHHLAGKDAIQIIDLESEHFILMREEHCLGDQVLDFCHQSDFHPMVSGRSTQIETILALVNAGLGISLVPAMAMARDYSPSLVFRSLEDPHPRRQVAAMWPLHRPLSRLGREFLDHLRDDKVLPRDIKQPNRSDDRGFS